MPDKIDLLSEDLIERHPQLALDVLAECSRLRRGLGWHYLLDLIWLISELDLEPGSTVLDAGAGMGMMQFLLANAGYRVISADMAVRNPPAEFRRLYRFEQMGSEQEIDHEYLIHHGWADRPGSAKAAAPAPSSFLDAPLRQLPRRMLSRLRPRRGQARSPKPSPPSPPPPDPDRPSIVLYRCELTRMPEIEDGSVDAVVSVSALEHNPSEVVRQITRELERITRPGGVMLHTVSACKSGTDHHKASHSFLLDEAGLADAYGLQNPDSNFERFDEIFGSLKNSRHLRRWLGSSYYNGGTNGMPWGVWNPQYQPVGIRKDKPR